MCHARGSELILAHIFIYGLLDFEDELELDGDVPDGDPARWAVILTVWLEVEDQCQAVIRINPRDCDSPSNGVAIPLGAREALDAIDAAF
ncbi:hypothetical protein A6X21_08320 [Planctopirus hydrillae]|uniref:Uncharacterized protein n=1 Tax=Planctopirus hydrillae TaxID=1841610 RepID=A0A1C3E8U4_9PLAN|nr:hypothetical protein A6X21_08320 [Planctopirus hydrillae]